ncbi:MAG: FG-GAP repeat domain-containing protein [Planctomycetota bacterium]|jgi:hypothetical protein
MLRFLHAAPALLAGGSLLTPAAAQFTLATQGVPTDSRSTEHVDFADVDLDGDWDAAFANGGDSGTQQNTLWINLGGAQGGTLGHFEDQSALRVPAVNDVSREIEFADIDGDGDEDVYVANDSQILVQTPRWWVNTGGLQGQSAGFFADETAERWVGIGEPGSSVHPNFVYFNGGFIDWGGEGEFADLDNDGDLDLIHASYGGSQSGQSPSRLFLNDGLGFFTEFNPSGHVSAQSFYPDGDPALWAEGLHFDDAPDATGQAADIADAVSDVEALDYDGDFDLDFVWSGLNEGLQLFENRGVGPQGLLPFRDVTAAVFGPQDNNYIWVYDVEAGDLDGDDDIDLYVINGLPFEGPFTPISDGTLAGDGVGGFVPLQSPVPDTGADDNEADFFDYDNDGIMDVWVASFTGDDRLFRGLGGGLLQEVPMDLGYSSISWDADLADVDLDGDLDAITCDEPFGPNVLLLNVTNQPDTIAPRVPDIEALAGGPAAAGVRPVRAKVLDNSPNYITWYADVELRVNVDGFDLAPRDVSPSGGEVFRGELPANLVGGVSYSVRATDAYGNAGVSATAAFTGTGDNGTVFGSGSTGPDGPLPSQVLSAPIAGELLAVGAGPVPVGSFAWLAAADSGSPTPVDLGGGLVLNLTLPWFFLEGGPVGADGRRVWEVALPSDAAGGSFALQTVALRADTGGFQSASGHQIAVAAP